MKNTLKKVLLVGLCVSGLAGTSGIQAEHWFKILGGSVASLASSLTVYDFWKSIDKIAIKAANLRVEANVLPHAQYLAKKMPLILQREHAIVGVCLAGMVALGGMLFVAQGLDERTYKLRENRKLIEDGKLMFTEPVKEYRKYSQYN